MEKSSESKNIFLSGKWKHLAMLNFVVDPEILKPYLPFGTELDLYSGQAFVSLVGFMFEDTRLMGAIKVPFHQKFEEVNLRFYVTRNENGTLKRGVVFITEYVPLPTLAARANRLYGEHYSTSNMRHDVLPGFLSSYHWGENYISIETD